ncbi:motility associated factor glycosyltransferase family protein [Alicyclobacillus macrosporangiidus]|uniref:motility associated factor glycosyltransferase family protein n=1 Tax=Alicyclobacillus macrosporangiidus TaxID=392015 RepID=UPI0018CC5340|nr:6-hydroxymethylpterin diphosphokinase MptE-like protein [Alicyclobacillus macrosporangiidus]
MRSWRVDSSECSLPVLGLGLGYHIEACLLQHPHIQEIAVIEPYREVVDLAREVRPQVLSDPRVTVIVPKDESECRHVLGACDMSRLRVHPPSVEVFPYASMRWLIQEAQMLRASVERNVGMLDMNFAANRDAVRPENVFTGMRDRYAGSMGIVVAAGPSLNEAIPWLPQCARAGAVILSVGQVLRKLLQNGVVPQYVLVTDGQEFVAEQLKDLPVGPLPTLICTPTVHPNLRDTYGGDILWAMQRGYAPSEELAERHGWDTFEVGGSVATLALSVAHHLGCDPIVFVGQDLAYVDGKSHAEDTHHQHIFIHGDSFRRIWTESVTGEEIETTLSWNSFRHWIERFIRDHPDRTYLNASRGAHIAGTQHVCPWAMESLV